MFTWLKISIAAISTCFLGETESVVSPSEQYAVRYHPPHHFYVAKEVYTLVNGYRESKGLRTLKNQKELNEIAFEHSNAMANGKIGFSHSGFEQRVREVKQYAYVAYKVAENLYAIVSKDSVRVPHQALEGWIESPGHKKNMEGDFLFTGIGVDRSRGGEYFITQLFVGKYTGR